MIEAVRNGMLTQGLNNMETGLSDTYIRKLRVSGDSKKSKKICNNIKAKGKKYGFSVKVIETVSDTIEVEMKFKKSQKPLIDNVMEDEVVSLLQNGFNVNSITQWIIDGICITYPHMTKNADITDIDLTEGNIVVGTKGKDKDKLYYVNSIVKEHSLADLDLFVNQSMQRLEEDEVFIIALVLGEKGDDISLLVSANRVSA